MEPAFRLPGQRLGSCLWLGIEPARAARWKARRRTPLSHLGETGRAIEGQKPGWSGSIPGLRLARRLLPSRIRDSAEDLRRSPSPRRRSCDSGPALAQRRGVGRGPGLAQRAGHSHRRRSRCGCGPGHASGRDRGAAVRQAVGLIGVRTRLLRAFSSLHPLEPPGRRGPQHGGRHQGDGQEDPHCRPVDGLAALDCLHTRQQRARP
jgi:hypothetical protein